MTAAARRFVTLTSTSLPRSFPRPQQKLPSLLNILTTRSFSQTTSHNFTSTSLKMGVHNIADLKAFKSEIIEADASTLVVLDCFAVWCGPCKTIAPTIAKYSEEYPTAKFFKVDVDEASDVAQELAIRAMPTFLFFKNGEKVGEVVGANARQIEATIKQHL